MSVYSLEFNKIADTILQGNMKELRNQTTIHFKDINRKYKDHHIENSIIHMVCQEGYFPMLTYMEDPKNHTDLDKNDLEISPKNMRNRTPLFLCFTPPVATFVGQSFGLDSDGNPIPQMPDDLDNPADWIKPGGPKSRENCIRFLLNKGADLNERDFHDFTCLHYAVMWGWVSTVKLLLERYFHPFPCFIFIIGLTEVPMSMHQQFQVKMIPICNLTVKYC